MAGIDDRIRIFIESWPIAKRQLGELAEREEKIEGKRLQGEVTTKATALPSGKPPKYERLGLSEKRMHQSQSIAKHPEIVERVKAQARENEDIPTREELTAGEAKDTGEEEIVPCRACSEALQQQKEVENE
jgi:hypothetical protein